jgi:hypothetical protein
MNRSNLKKPEYSLDLRNPTEPKNPATRMLTKKAAFFGKVDLAKWILSIEVAPLVDLCCTRNSLKSKQVTYIKI